MWLNRCSVKNKDPKKEKTLFVNTWMWKQNIHSKLRVQKIAEIRLDSTKYFKSGNMKTLGTSQKILYSTLDTKSYKSRTDTNLFSLAIKIFFYLLLGLAHLNKTKVNSSNSILSVAQYDRIKIFNIWKK